MTVSSDEQINNAKSRSSRPERSVGDLETCDGGESMMELNPPVSSQGE